MKLHRNQLLENRKKNSIGVKRWWVDPKNKEKILERNKKISLARKGQFTWCTELNKFKEKLKC